MAKKVFQLFPYEQKIPLNWEDTGWISFLEQNKIGERLLERLQTDLFTQNLWKGENKEVLSSIVSEGSKLGQWENWVILNFVSELASLAYDAPHYDNKKALQVITDFSASLKKALERETDSPFHALKNAAVELAINYRDVGPLILRKFDGAVYAANTLAHIYWHQYLQAQGKPYENPWRKVWPEIKTPQVQEPAVQEETQPQAQQELTAVSIEDLMQQADVDYIIKPGSTSNEVILQLQIDWPELLQFPGAEVKLIDMEGVERFSTRIDKANKTVTLRLTRDLLEERNQRLVANIPVGETHVTLTRYLRFYWFNLADLDDPQQYEQVLKALKDVQITNVRYKSYTPDYCKISFSTNLPKDLPSFQTGAFVLGKDGKRIEVPAMFLEGNFIVFIPQKSVPQSGNYIIEVQPLVGPYTMTLWVKEQINWPSWSIFVPRSNYFGLNFDQDSVLTGFLKVKVETDYPEVLEKAKTYIKITNEEGQVFYDGPLSFEHSGGTGSYDWKDFYGRIPFDRNVLPNGKYKATLRIVLPDGTEEIRELSTDVQWTYSRQQVEQYLSQLPVEVSFEASKDKAYVYFHIPGLDALPVKEGKISFYGYGKSITGIPIRVDGSTVVAEVDPITFLEPARQDPKKNEWRYHLNFEIDEHSYSVLKGNISFDWGELQELFSAMVKASAKASVEFNSPFSGTVVVDIDTQDDELLAKEAGEVEYFIRKWGSDEQPTRYFRAKIGENGVFTLDINSKDFPSGSYEVITRLKWGSATRTVTSYLKVQWPDVRSVLRDTNVATQVEYTDKEGKFVFDLSSLPDWLNVGSAIARLLTPDGKEVYRAVVPLDGTPAVPFSPEEVGSGHYLMEIQLDTPYGKMVRNMAVAVEWPETLLKAKPAEEQKPAEEPKPKEDPFKGAAIELQLSPLLQRGEAVFNLKLPSPLEIEEARITLRRKGTGEETTLRVTPSESKLVLPLDASQFPAGDYEWVVSLVSQGVEKKFTGTIQISWPETLKASFAQPSASGNFGYVVFSDTPFEILDRDWVLRAVLYDANGKELQRFDPITLKKNQTLPKLPVDTTKYPPGNYQALLELTSDGVKKTYLASFTVAKPQPPSTQSTTTPTPSKTPETPTPPPPSEGDFTARVILEGVDSSVLRTPAEFKFKPGQFLSIALPKAGQPANVLLDLPSGYVVKEVLWRPAGSTETNKIYWMDPLTVFLGPKFNIEIIIKVAKK